MFQIFMKFENTIFQIGIYLFKLFTMFTSFNK